MTQATQRGSHTHPHSHALGLADHDHEACVDEAMERARNLCIARGSRLTALREQVLRIVWRSHNPIGAYEVLDELAKEHKSARPPTVYRALEFLQLHGLVHKIETRNAFLGCAEAGIRHEAQFFICERCGTAEEVIDDGLTKAVEDAAKAHSFAVDRKVIEIAGLCERCQS